MPASSTIRPVGSADLPAFFADMFRVDGERLGYLFMARALHTLIVNSD